ncbi:hypothetical protein [Rubrivirga marina]|uniref:Uncharacterized protein n=1 Tax=Rubrivirga marina TaxID=1196024 RepID=A0A271J1C2_9BACT|nr:hypothetical protein [Rubrivirga marina]PAP77292.1 hypothetical protein BSZ37_13030 [Rubrivirga marina]
MRIAAVVLLIAVASGCAATAPASVVAPSPAVVVAVEPPAPPPVPVAERPEVVELAPLVPPPVPERRIERRSVYEQAGVTEWTLANGLTVVYLHEPNADVYRARVQAPTGWVSLPASMRSVFEEGGAATWGGLLASVEPRRRVAVAEAETLAELVGSVEALFTRPSDPPVSEAIASAFDRPSDFVVVLSGPVEREWVEPVIATALAPLRGRDSEFGPLLETPEPIASASLVAEINAGWDDLPAIVLLSHLLADRSGRGDAVRLDFDAPRRVAHALVDPSGAGADVFRPASDDAIRVARTESARAAASPEGRILALAILYEVPGNVRPARPPSDALTLSDRIERTPPARVVDLLGRLAQAAVVTAPPPLPSLPE